LRELEITPEPDDPAVAAAIVRALEQAEREWEEANGPAHERSAWLAEARLELVDDGLA
jgi:hypothetical protein